MLPDSVDFYVFSGTGNTLLCARAMAETFEAAGKHVTLHALESADPARVDTAALVGLAFPVAVASTYPLVWRFAEALPLANGTPVFMLDTLGGTSGGMVGPLRRLVEKKGYRPVGAKEIRMPGNFLVPERGEKAQAKIERGKETARAYAREILEERAAWGRTPGLSDALAAVSRFVMFRLWPIECGRFIARMQADPARCTKCGLCAKLCPVGAIEMRDVATPTAKCQLCQRCAVVCPTEAMRLNRARVTPNRAVPAAEFEALHKP